MRTLLPFLDAGSDRRSHRDIRDSDLLKAHAFGPRLVAAWQRGGARQWRDLTLSFLLAGVMPILGRWFLAWPVWIMVFCMACDMWFTWLGDGIKIALADASVRRQIDLANDGDITYAVAYALRDRGSRGSGFLGGAGIALRLDPALATPARWMRENLLVCVLVSILAALIWHMSNQVSLRGTPVYPSLLVALAFSALSRLVASAIIARKNCQPLDREMPQMLPDSMIGGEVIFLAVLGVGVEAVLMVTPWASALADSLHWQMSRAVLGNLLFFNYAIIAVLLTAVWRRRLWERERLVREFLSVDLERQRVRLHKLLSR
jgi:hypothetical protein